MLTVEVFEDRVKALYRSQKGMAAAKKWKSGKRAGNVRRPALAIHYTEGELKRWLWSTVGLNAVPCPYCRCPIDILSLTLDHITPRVIGGEFTLENTQATCVPCNQMKGPLTHEAFDNLIRFMRSELSPYDQDALLARLKAAHAGSMQRFGRNRDAQERKAQQLQPPAPPAVTPGLDFSGLGKF